MPRGIILIVDDDPMNLKLAKILVEDAGFDVVTAASASEAVRVLETVVVGGVLLDIELPDRDGLELCRQLKTDPRWKHLKIIAVTAHAMAGDEQKARDAGCDGYISKPIDAEHLARVVIELLTS